MTELRVGVDIPYLGHPSEVREYAQQMEALGFHHLGFSDKTLKGESVDFRSPFNKMGRRVDVSPEMAAQARQRMAGMRAGAGVTVVESPVELFTPDCCADALLLCYTHDVLQSPSALDRMLSVSKPGARIVIVGMKTLPWLWGWPLNIVNMYRGRGYLTTYANLDCPWRLLSERGARLREVQTALWGTAYIAVGTLCPTDP